jgi:hypothetical protein
MQKLDYFLFMKKKYKNILDHLNAIYLQYTDILDLKETNEFTNINMNVNMEFENISRNKCKTQIQHTEYYLERIEKEIFHLCNHNYVEDYIDINLDTSTKIIYCTICENTL